MNMKRLVTALVACCALMLSMVAFVGCDNSEQVIRDGINRDIQQIKDLDGETVEQVSAEMPMEELEQMGLTSEEVMKAVFAGFDGTVDSVTVNGKTAEAVVTFTSKNLSGLEDQMMGLLDEVIDDPEQFADMSEDEIYQWCGAKMMEFINDTPAETHEPLTLNCELEGNTWEVTEASQTELANVIFGEGF